MTTETFLTTSQAAEMLSISVSRVRQIADRLGGLRTGRDWLFRADAVQAYRDSDQPKRGRPPKPKHAG